ncbi:MAG: methyltransferase [Anaerolineales bacterium]|nr:methyltransferase [Anaerolineales bacterium]
MNSRERVLAAIDHKEPDGVPLDLGSTPSSGISAIAYVNFKNYLGIERGHTRVYDVVQQLAQPEDEIIERFRVDVLDIGRAFDTSDADWYDFTLPQDITVQFPAWFKPIKREDGGWDAFAPDGTRIATMPATGTFYDQTCFPYESGYPDNYADLPAAMSKVLWAGLPHSPWNHAGEADFWAQLRARAIHLRETTDKALMVVVGCNLFEWGTFLRRIDNFLMDLVTEPEQVESLLDALMERHMVTLENVCRSVGDVVDICRFGDDLGMDRGPFMSPDVYRRLFKPRERILTDYVKQHSQMHTFLHSCGSIYKLLPDLIDAGFEIFNPVQISSRDMEPERLKREFGKDATFWGGGADTRHILNHGTPEKVKEHVRKNIEAFAPGGGFVFNTVHNILSDVPPENIEAMYAALDEYR